MHRSLHKMLFIATSGALVIGLVSPAAAEEAPRRTDVQRVDVRPEVRPDVRPEVRPDVRPDFAVLSLGCEGRRDDTGNLGAVCRWSATDGVRAYQLWRVVDRGHRELVGTFDNTTTIARDDVPDDAHLVRYAVLALDADGDIIGRSRVVRIRFRQTDTPRIDREVDVRRVDHDGQRRLARFRAV